MKITRIARVPSGRLAAERALPSWSWYCSGSPFLGLVGDGRSFVFCRALIEVPLIYVVREKRAIWD
jgi:hypothetical protein